MKNWLPQRIKLPWNLTLLSKAGIGNVFIESGFHTPTLSCCPILYCWSPARLGQWAEAHIVYKEVGAPLLSVPARHQAADSIRKCVT